ncbi:hypothetical protein [Paenibacillus wenxiniae]|uniref:Uncharacterized protein n=1 Tax=Paenibacillus wenxiniae TaxID=1636843 RepID=A0ABW4RG81_9BACL
MTEPAYAYIDRSVLHVFHVLADYKAACLHASGRVVEYRGEHEYGYPMIDGEPLIIYTKTMKEKNKRSIPPYISAAIDALK